MIDFKGARSAVCIAAIFAGSTAFADVSAQQVWDNWKDQMAMYGEGGVTIGSETMSGDTLTVTDLSIQMSDPESSITATLSEIQLTELGNGTVSITMSEAYPMAVAIDDGALAVNITARHDGMAIIVSGTQEVMEYALSAQSYAISVDSVEGDDAGEIKLNAAALTLTNLSGNYVTRTDNLRRIDYEISAESLGLAVDVSEPGGSGMVIVNGTIADLTAQSKTAIPLDMDMDAPENAFLNGLSFEGGYTFGAANYDFDFSADGEEASGAATIQGGSLSAAMDIDGMLYDGETRGVSVLLNIPTELPFPIEAQLSAYGFALDIPLSRAEEPRDFAMAINFADLVVSNGIWNMLDPGEILPRDPATVSIELSGTATPFFDLLDPEQAEAAAMSERPGELNTLSLDGLKLAVAGALVTGNGRFVFDNDDLQTFDGFPRPKGAVTLNINGVNGLIDKLIQMGLLPAEEAMGGRMMLGMFATPVGDDMLTSTIEVNDEGHVLANGQRLR